MVATLKKTEISRMCCKHLQTCRKYYMLYVENHSTLGESLCMYT